MTDPPKHDYNGLTLEKLEAVIKEYFDNAPMPSDLECRQLTDEEVASLRKIFGCLIDGMGPKLYKICGAVTGQGGWDLFNQALREQLNNETNDIGKSSG